MLPGSLWGQCNTLGYIWCNSTNAGTTVPLWVETNVTWQGITLWNPYLQTSPFFVVNNSVGGGQIGMGTTAGRFVNIDTNGPTYFNGGNFGIGTATPPTNLSVAPSGTGSGLGVGWNRSGDGETNLYNYGQGGPGGFTFYNYSGNAGSWPSGSPTALMTLLSNGAVGIGTQSPAHLLHVAGTIGAEEVIISSTGADYVFDPGYRLAPLTEVSDYIEANHHLPEIPSAAEGVAKGVSLGEMQSKLLAKIEELTLHMIQTEKENRELRECIGRLETATVGK
jgi:hypothetical protein